MLTPPTRNMTAADATIDIRAALHDITQWHEAACAALVGRRVRVVTGVDAGDVHTVQSARMTMGLNGFQMEVYMGRKGHGNAKTGRVMSRALGISCVLMEDE